MSKFDKLSQIEAINNAHLKNNIKQEIEDKTVVVTLKRVPKVWTQKVKESRQYTTFSSFVMMAIAEKLKREELI